MEQFPSLRALSASRGESAKRRSASSVRRKGSEWKKSKRAANAPSLCRRTEWEFSEKRRAKGTNMAIAKGMKAMKEMPSAIDRE